MPVLTREDILSGRSLKREQVTVPELGGDVFVFELAPKQRNAFLRWCLKMKDNPTPVEGIEGSAGIDVWASMDYSRNLLVRALRDENARLLFTPEDVDALAETISDELTDRLASIARGLSGLGDDAIEKRADDPNSSDASTT